MDYLNNDVLENKVDYDYKRNELNLFNILKDEIQTPLALIYRNLIQKLWTVFFILVFLPNFNVKYHNNDF